MVDIPWSAHQAASSARTRAGARGSAKVAVPTWTASAPAASSSAAAAPVPTPPTPDDRDPGQGGPAFVDGPHRDRVDGRARQPSSAAAEAGPPGGRVEGQAHDGVDQGDGVRAGFDRGGGQGRAGR